MPSFVVVSVRFAPLLAVLALLLPSPTAFALSKRDQAHVDTLNQRMAEAEKKYRDALVKAGNSDPDGVTQSNAALEDMEDVVDACGKQKGCSPSQMMAVYKRLLKDRIDTEGAGDEGDADDILDHEPDHVAVATLGDDVPEAVRAANLLDDKRHRFDTMVQYNPAIQAGIRRWLTDMRPALMDSYENYEYMRQLMWPSFERAGLPEALLFGILAKESNGKVHATSRAGAAGPMQFMYATGTRFGLGQDGTGFDTRYDPYSSAVASAEYLNERMGQLNNSIELALAAYNGGEGRALRIFNGSGGRGFWEADVYNQFPAETRDYVPMVIAAAWLFLHPRKYGLSFPKVHNKSAQLKLTRPSSIYELTICLGNGGTRDGFMRALRNLNPRYKPESYLPAGAGLNATTQIVGLYNRHCAQGPRAELARQLVMSDASRAIVSTGPLEPVADDGAITPAPVAVAAEKKPAMHKVTRNETLVSIAQKYECDTKSLAKANGLKSPRYMVKMGQRLKLEGCRQ